jgi:pullulanase/glycogen debranching enzyme
LSEKEERNDDRMDKRWKRNTGETREIASNFTGSKSNYHKQEN